MMRVRFHVNGLAHELDCAPGRSLLDILREDCGLTAAKPGCEVGRCGACMVWLDGVPVNACLVPAIRLDGRQVATYEAVAAQDASLPVRAALAECGGLQCGYCTPGLAMTLTYLHQLPRRPHAAEAAQLASGNLCRCTGYGGIRRCIDRLFGPASQGENP